MTIYLCPKVNQWSHEECDCPGEKDDEEHAGIDIPDPAATIARLVNFLGAVHDRLTDEVGDEAEPVAEEIADVYLEVTGNLL